MSTLRIDRQLASDAIDTPDLSTLQRWADAVTATTQAQGDVCVRLVNDEEIHSLNRQFRQQDKVTNVLSFPAASPVLLSAADLDASDHDYAVALEHLGDIAICCAQVRREASEQGKALPAHYAHMLIHGLLHLLGYDHQNDAETGAMEALEIRILAALNFSDPYRNNSVTGCSNSQQSTPASATQKSAQN